MRKLYQVFVGVVVLALLSAGQSFSHDDVRIISQPVLTVPVGELYVYDVEAVSDDSVDVIEFFLDMSPQGMTIDRVTGVITWVPLLPGPFRVEVRAEANSSGQGGGHDEQEFTVRVTNGQPSVLRGFVQSQSGVGVPDVRLRLFEVSSGHFVLRTHTGQDGEYEFPEVSPGTYLLRVQPPGNSIFARQWFDRVRQIQDATPIVVPESTTVTINVTLLPRDSAEVRFTLSGNVSDTGGAPIARTKVFIFRVRQHHDADSSGMNFLGLDDDDRRQDLAATAITDSNGNYSVLLRARTYILMAFKPGFEKQFWDHKTNVLEADRLRLEHDTSGIDFDLRPLPPGDGAIAGTIAARTHGDPVQAHVLGFHKAHPNGGFTGFVRHAETDSLGRYELNALQSGFYVVLALPQGDFLPTFYDTSGGTTHLDEAVPVPVINGLVDGIDIYVFPDTVSGMNRVRGVVASGDVPVPGTILYAVSATNNHVIASGISVMDGSYSLVGLAPGSYRLRGVKPGFQTSVSNNFALDYVGNLPSTAVRNVLLQGNPVSAENGSDAPKDFMLLQNHPNPFNPSTRIQFSVPSFGRVRLAVYTILGQHVSTIVDAALPPGTYSVKWDGIDAATGVYFYRLEFNGSVKIKRMLLLR